MAVEEITIEQLAERLAAGGVRLIDVREPAEFDEARVPGAVSIPLASVPDHLAELSDGDGDLIMICRGGGRSWQACEFLDHNGVAAINVAGGTMGWIMAGHETDSGPLDADRADSAGSQQPTSGTHSDDSSGVG